jgi:PhnB protein
MAIKSITPYLMFDGTAEKAIKLYESALGATTKGLMRFGDTPGDEHCKTQADKDRVMHAMLHIDGATIMVSDGMPGTPGPTDSNVHITLDFDDLAEMTRKFDALAEGGKVTLALHDTFWGAKFGMITDAFGIRWMFNHEIKKS